MARGRGSAAAVKVIVTRTRRKPLQAPSESGKQDVAEEKKKKRPNSRRSQWFITASLRYHASFSHLFCVAFMVTSLLTSSDSIATRSNVFEGA